MNPYNKSSHLTPTTPYPSKSNASLNSALISSSPTTSTISLHISPAIFSLRAATPLHLFHSLSTSSLSSAVTFFALPAFRPSSRAVIAVFSASSACTLATRSAVLSVELSEASVLRRVLAVAWRLAVRVWRSAMVASRAASWSVVQDSEASCG